MPEGLISTNGYKTIGNQDKYGNTYPTANFLTLAQQARQAGDPFAQAKRLIDAIDAVSDRLPSAQAIFSKRKIFSHKITLSSGGLGTVGLSYES